MIVTEWDEFRQIDWTKLLSIVEQPLLIDGRNMFDPEQFRNTGFRYVGIGRAAAPSHSEGNRGTSSRAISRTPIDEVTA